MHDRTTRGLYLFLWIRGGLVIRDGGASSQLTDRHSLDLVRVHVLAHREDLQLALRYNELIRVDVAQ